MLRVQSYLPAGTPGDEPSGYVTLAHDQRHLRRKLLHLQNDEMVMLDLKEAVLFAHGDLLVVEMVTLWRSGQPMKNCLK